MLHFNYTFANGTVTRLLAAFLFILCGTAAIAQTATFTGLGSFDANALSRNGQVVVGTDFSTNKAAYWSHGSVTVLSGVAYGSVATACNVDGSIIVGENNGLPFSWTGGNLTTLPLLASTSGGGATLISADGSVIAGYCQSSIDNSLIPVIWTSSGVYALPNTNASTVLNSISDDGSTIVSGSDQYNSDFNNIFTQLAEGVQSQIFNISGNGSTISDFDPEVFTENGEPADEQLFCLTFDGSAEFGGSFDGYPKTYNYYDQTTQKEVSYTDPFSDGFWPVQAIGSTSTQLGNLTNFEARSCNFNGNILGGVAVALIFGNDQYGNSSLESAQHGNSEIDVAGNVQDFKTFLTGKGVNTTGWTLNTIPTQGMSDDGTVILGFGVDPNNVDEQFIATISPAVTSVVPSQSSFAQNSTNPTTIGLDFPAPTGGSTVYVTSSNTGAIPNWEVVVNQGAMSATFNLSSSSVLAPTSVTLTATLGTSSATATVTVIPVVNTISEIYSTASRIVGGNAVTGYVQLGTTAPAGGQTVALSSSNGSLSVPATITVAAGATVASFPINSTPVTSATQVTISANTYGSLTESTVVTLVIPSIALVRVAPSSVIGGSSTQCAVYLNGKAPAAGEVVTISSSSTLAQVPATYTVSAGATDGNFTITTSSVTSSTLVSISAAAGSTTVSTSFLINSVPYPYISGFYPSAGVVVGGNAATATVTLAYAAPTGGYAVSLSSNTSGVTVPATVTVPGGQKSAKMSLITNPVTAVTQATLTATLGPYTEYTIVTVIPPSVSLVRVSPSPVVGGTSTKVAVYLNGQAPTGGFVVSLSSNNTSAQVPTTITVPAGATAANATLTTSKVATATTVVITAKTGAVSTLTSMVLNP